MLTDINILSEEELKKFEDFVNSPYFNKYDSVKKLFCFLRDNHPSISPSDVSDKSLSENVFNESNINFSKIRKLKSNYSFLFEKFLMHEDFRKSKIRNDFTALVAFRKRHLSADYQKKLKHISGMPGKYFGTDEEYYLNMHYFYNEMFMDSFSNESSKAVEYSVRKINYLNYYFIYQSLVFNCNLYSDKSRKPSSTLFSVSMIEDVYRIIEKNKKHFSSGFPDIMLLYYASLMIQTGNLKYYLKLKKYFEKNPEIFDYNLTTMYFIISESFLKLKAAKDLDKKILKRLFILREEIIREKHYDAFFGEGRWISPEIFFRIINDMVNLKKFERAEDFVSQFKNFLPQNYKHETLNIVRIILDFFSGNFINLISNLHGVNKNNFTFFMYSRYVKLMFLYDAGEMTGLEYEIESAKKFLLRKAAEKRHSEIFIKKSLRFVNTVAFLLRISTGKINRKGKKFTSVLNDLKKGKTIPEYSFWFLQNINKLEKEK